MRVEKMYSLWIEDSSTKNKPVKLGSFIGRDLRSACRVWLQTKSKVEIEKSWDAKKLTWGGLRIHSSEEGATKLNIIVKISRYYQKVSDEDLSIVGITDSDLELEYNKVPTYVSSLIIAICTAFRVTPIFDKTGDASRNTKVILVGESVDVEIAKYVYDHLRRSLEIAILEKKKQFKLAGHKGSSAGVLARRFAEGWTIGIYTAVKEFEERLMPKDSDNHMRYLSSKGVSTSNKPVGGKRRGTKDEADAFKNGVDEGKTANIFAGVRESEQLRSR